jgi:REP element-mobilizing transposase RayT
MGTVLGFHVICCTYGFWLPNDERGSGSDFVRSDVLTRFRPANLVTHGRSMARKPFDHEVRRMSRDALRYQAVRLTDAQIAAVGRGISNEIETFRATAIHALAVLDNHVHLVCGPCRYDVRRFAGRLKGAATRQLIKEGIHQLREHAGPDGGVPSCWSVKPWVVYLFTNEAVERTIRYTQDNLVRARMKPQAYRFVTPYGAMRASGL